MNESKRAYQKEYDSRPEVKDRKRIQSRYRYSKNPEPKRTRSIAWAKSNPDKVKEKHKKWVENNSERLKAWRRDYQIKRCKNDPEFYASRVSMGHTRRCLKSGNVNQKPIKDFIKSVRSKRTAVCYYCQKQVSTKDVHFDHMVPLSKGGPHSVENLCVSCAHCNLSKHDKMLQDFVKLGQQLLSL